MKKITLLLAGLMASGMASAVQVDLTAVAANSTVTTLDCSLLNEDVKVSLTTGVAAGIGCNPTAISLAACHTAGRLTARTAMLKDDATTGTKVPCTVAADGAACTATQVTGPAMPIAHTLAGTVVSRYPGGDCSGGDAAAFAETEAGKLVPAAP